MIHDLISHSASVWPRIGLVFFLIFFAIVLLWTLRGGRNRFEQERNLPLDTASKGQSDE